MDPLRDARKGGEFLSGWFKTVGDWMTAPSERLSTKGCLVLRQGRVKESKRPRDPTGRHHECTSAESPLSTLNNPDHQRLRRTTNSVTAPTLPLQIRGKVVSRLFQHHLQIGRSLMSASLHTSDSCQTVQV